MCWGPALAGRVADLGSQLSEANAKAASDIADLTTLVLQFLCELAEQSAKCKMLEVQVAGLSAERDSLMTSVHEASAFLDAETDGLRACVHSVVSEVAAGREFSREILEKTAYEQAKGLEFTAPRLSTDVTAAEARRAMRGSRKAEAIAKGSGEAASVVDAVFAEADHAAGSSLVGAESAIAWAEDEGFVEASSQVSVLAELVTRKMEILEHTLMARIQVIEANLKEQISQLMKLAVGHHQDIKTLREAMPEDDEEDDEEEEQG